MGSLVGLGGREGGGGSTILEFTHSGILERLGWPDQEGGRLGKSVVLR